jgi:hypothetical protein
MVMKKICVALAGIMFSIAANAFPLIGYCKPDKDIKVQYKVEKANKDGKSTINFTNHSDCSAKIKIVYKSVTKGYDGNSNATTFVKAKDKSSTDVPVKDNAPDKSIVSIEVVEKNCK